MKNLLIEPVIHAAPRGMLTLPGVLAALTRDEVDNFSALRPYQAPAWHMFLVQLAALAMSREGAGKIPEDGASWAAALRGLTTGFNADEPWCLTVNDSSKPAFLQPPVPDGVTLQNIVASPDALDLLITARNHDVKQTVGRNGRLEDWVFALVSLQTGDGYGGRDNQGIARMNGGSSSRAMLTLAPLPADMAKVVTPRPGARFRRDVAVLLETREKELRSHDHLAYPETGGLGLTWLAPWPEGNQLQLSELDIWFIEVCRRIRLQRAGETLIGRKGTSKATRINAKHLKGALGDPFAPVHKTEHKSLTLGGREFDYRLLTDLLLSGDWTLPVLARPGSADHGGETMAVVAEALARGNSKTEGFKSRVLPLGGEVSRALGAQRERLHELALQQIDEIGVVDKALGFGLALVAAGGDCDRGVKKEHYAHAREARRRLDGSADTLFFPHLWDRFEAQEQGGEAQTATGTAFTAELLKAARQSFETALPAIPCAKIYRARAETRGKNAFFGRIRHQFPELFEAPDRQESTHGA